MSRDLFLDADRASGEFVMELTADDAAEARRSGVVGAPHTAYAQPSAVISMRPFELTSISIEDAGNDAEYSALNLVKGCMVAVTVYASEILGRAEPYPTAVRVPPRQNLSITVLHPEAMKIRCTWRHVEGSFE